MSRQDVNRALVGRASDEVGCWVDSHALDAGSRLWGVTDGGLGSHVPDVDHPVGVADD